MTVPEAAGAKPADGTMSARPAVSAMPAEPAELVVPPALGATGFADPAADWLRLSPRSMIVQPLTDLVRLLPLVAGLVVLHSHTDGGLVWGIGAAALAVLTGLAHWATTRYLITDERVYLRRGLLNQKRLSVARDRIRTVDVTAHLLHRMLGVCRVSIGTGRNDFKPGESFHLDGLTRAQAEALRLALLTASTRAGFPAALAAHGAVAGAEVVAGQDAGHELAALRLSWLRFAPLTMTGLVVLGVLCGAVVQLTNATDVNIAATGPVRLVVADYAALSLIQRIGVDAVVGTAGYVLVALIGYIAVYWNFRLTGDGTDTVRVTRGLLSVRATTISLSRLRGVEISESLLLRAARGARCTAITTGLRVGQGAEHEGSVLLPPAPSNVARAVAASVLKVPQELCSGPLRQHGPAARRRRYLRALAGAAAIIAAIGVATVIRHGSGWVVISSLGLIPAALAVAADRYRSLGHLLAGGWLVTRTGSLVRRRSIIGVDAIIGWRIHQTWFQRRLGLMTLTATTAAGHQHYSVRDIPVEQGLALAAAVTGDLVPPFLQRLCSPAAAQNGAANPEPSCPLSGSACSGSPGGMGSVAG